MLGTQVLCSDLPVHRELDAPGTLFFPFDGVSELADLMVRSYDRSRRTISENVEHSMRLNSAYGRKLFDICTAVSGNREIYGNSDRYALGRSDA